MFWIPPVICRICVLQIYFPSMWLAFSFSLWCLFLFLLHRAACGILVPWPGIKPMPPAVEARSLNHWTAREVPVVSLKIPFNFDEVQLYPACIDTASVVLDSFFVSVKMFPAYCMYFISSTWSQPFSPTYSPGSFIGRWYFRTTTWKALD